jgi:hypothetical protein
MKQFQILWYMHVNLYRASHLNETKSTASGLSIFFSSSKLFVVHKIIGNDINLVDRQEGGLHPGSNLHFCKSCLLFSCKYIYLMLNLLHVKYTGYIKLIIR